MQPSHTGNNIPVPVVFISSFWFFIDNNYYYLCFFLCLDLLQGYENDLVNEDYLLSALDGVDMDSLPGYTVTQIPPGQLPGYILLHRSCPVSCQDIPLCSSRQVSCQDKPLCRSRQVSCQDLLLRRSRQVSYQDILLCRSHQVSCQDIQLHRSR